MKICQTHSNLILKCAIVQIGFPVSFRQTCYKLSKICFLFTFYRANEKIFRVWCFIPTSSFYNIFAHGLSIFFSANLKTCSFKITYLCLYRYLNIICKRLIKYPMKYPNLFAKFENKSVHKQMYALNMVFLII